MLTENEKTQSPTSKVGRRSFLQWSGGTIVAGGLLASACNDKKDDPAPPAGSVSLGSGDTGVLNYAYALEQLEAAFYVAVVANPSFATTFPDATERAYLTDIRDHEIAHREFFKAALGASAIKGLTPNFTAIDFTSRTSVLATAKAFEDLGVSAYNGAGKLFVNADYLVLAGKIVSVEARHAAYIRDRIQNGTFANTETIDSNGLDKARTPSEVLAIAGAYIVDKLDASKLPTN